MATRKTEWLASIKPILDKEEVKNDAKALARELSDILEFKVTDTESLEQLTKEFNKQLANMGKQPIVFSEKTLQGIVSQFANAIAEGLTVGFNAGSGQVETKNIGNNLGKSIGDGVAQGIVSGVKDGISAASHDIIAQLNDLQKRKNELHEQSANLDKKLSKYERLSEISTMEYDEFKPLSLDGDIDEQAQRIMGEFIDAEDALNEVTSGTKEYNAALIKALQAAERLYRMSRTINANKDLVKDKTLLSDFEFTSLSDTTADVFEKADADFNKILHNFYKYYENQIKNIKVELGQIDEQLIVLKQNKVEIIDQEKSKYALKTLKEIEDAQKRIEQKNKRSGGKTISGYLSAIEYEPGSESLQFLRNSYERSSNEDWESQYRWLIKFVKEYENYSKQIESETDNIKQKNMRARQKQYASLYEDLKPMAENAENSLRQVLNMQKIEAPSDIAGGSGSTTEDVTNAEKIAASERLAREEAEKKTMAEKEAAEFAKQKRIEEEKAAKATEKKRIEEEAAAEANRKAAESSEKEKIAKAALMTNTLRNVVDFSGKQSKEYMSLIGADATTDVVGGEDYTVATDVLVEQLIDNVKKSILMSLHNHPDDMLAFTPSDIVSYGKLYKAQGVDIHGIIADGVVQTIDFTDISQEVILQVVQAFSKNLSEVADKSEGLFSFKDGDLKVSDDVQALASESPDAYNKIKDQLQFVINNALSKAFTDNNLQPTIKTFNKENLQQLAEYLLQVGQNAGIAVNEAEKLNTLMSIKDKIVEGKKEETSAHQENTEAIKNETKVQEELNNVKSQTANIDDDSETIAKENGALEDKLELLRDISDQYAVNITQKQRDRYEELNQKDMDTGLSDKEDERYYELGEQIDAADSALEEFGQTYDRIILKLANGKKVEILPDDKGLRSLYKFSDEYGETYGGVEIEDVIFERVKQEANAHQENTTAIKNETKAQEELNQAKGQSPGAGDTSYADVTANKAEALQKELSTVKDENIQLQDTIEKLRTELVDEVNQNLEARGELYSQISDAEFERDKAQEYQRRAEAESRVKDGIIQGLREQLAQVQSGESGAKDSIGVEELKNVLNAITYNVKVVQDTDSTDSKVAIDETSLETTLNKVFANILNPQTQQNDGENTQSPWALESTLQTVKGVLEQIKYNTTQDKQLDTKNLIRDPRGNIVTAYRGTHDSYVGLSSNRYNGASFFTDSLDLARMQYAGKNGKVEAANLSMANPLELDAHGGSWAAIEYIGDNADEASQKLHQLQSKIEQLKILINAASDAQPGSMAAKIASLRSVDIEDLEKEKRKIFNDLNNPYGRYTTDQIAERLPEWGYDGAIIKNLVDGGTIPSTVMISLDPSQVHYIETLSGLMDDSNANELNAQQKRADGDGVKNNNNGSFALESTLQSVKGVLDNIQTNTSQIGTVNASNVDTIAGTALDGRLTEIKTVLESIDNKIAKGGVIATRGAVKQANADAQEAPAKSQAVRSNMMKSVINDYETLGKLSAQFANDGNLETKAKLENLKEEIKRKRASLTVTMEENAKLREQYSIAFDAQKRLLDAAKAQANINKQGKEDEKSWKNRVKDAQRETGINAADYTYKVANDTVLRAIGTKGISSDISKKAKELSDQVSALRTLRDKIFKYGEQASEEDRDDLSKQISAVKILKTELDGYLKIHEKYSGDNVTDLGDGSTFGAAGTNEYWNNITKAIQAQSTGRVVIKGLNADTGELTGTTKIAANTFAQWSATVDPITGRLSMLRTGIKKTETLMESITRKTKEIFTYFSGSSIIFKFFNELKRGVQYVKEIDLALTELKKVTDETEETYDKFLKTASKTGAEIGSTISDVTRATATFAKLGYNIDMASDMAKAALVYQNVGDGIESADAAAESIISTIKGFGLQASEAMTIVDRFNEVGNRFSITSKGIGDALQRSASALKEGGNSLDESIALITAANSVVQDPETVGTALKTLTLRLRGAKTELEDAGLEADNMAETTSALQKKLLALTGGKVNIMSDANTFKNTTQILREMASAWSDMNDIQRASALELMGGKRQANILSAIIQNFDVVENAIKTSADSAGSALKENEKYLNSIQGKLDLFNNAVQTMWSNALDSDVVKWLVNLGTELIKVVDTLGLIPSILLSIASFKILKSLFSGTDIVGFIKSIGALTMGTKVFEAETRKASFALIAETINTKLAGSALVEYAIKMKLASAADVAKMTTTQLLGLSFKALGVAVWGAVKAIAAFLFTNPVGWIILAIGAIAGGIAIFNHFHKTTEELTEELNDLKSGLSDIRSELDSVNQELETTNNRMAELLAKDKLTFEEQEELDRLRATNDELERRKELLQDEDEYQSGLVGRQAAEIVNKTKKETLDDGWRFSLYSAEEDILNKIEKYKETRSKLNNASSLKEREKYQKKLDKQSTVIDKYILSISEALDGVEYGDSEESDAALDYLSELQDIYGIARGSTGAKTNAIKGIFNKEEFAGIAKEIDKYVEALKNGDESASTSIDHIIKNNKDLVEDLEKRGLDIQDAVSYFTMLGQEANYSTLEGKIKEVSKAAINFEKLLKGGIFKVDNIDTGLADLFDEEGNVIQTKLSQIFQDTSDKTRKEITKLLESSYDMIADGLDDSEINYLMNRMGLSFSRAILEIEKSNLVNKNLELFPGLKDEISGIIDTFSELTSAIGSVVDAMDALDQARAEEAYSGSVSLETLEALMQSTDNYADLIEVDETDAIHLATDAQEILVAQKIEAIKQNAELSLKEAELAYQEALHNEQTYSQTGPAQEFMRGLWNEVGGAMAFVSSLWNDLTSGNWSGAWDRAKAARESSITTKEMEYSAAAAEASAAVADAAKNVENAEKMNRIAQGLTPENIKQRYSADEASGGNKTKEEVAEDAFKKAMDYWENRISANQSKYEQIQNAIDLIEKRGQRANKKYYQEQIELEHQRLKLLQQQKKEAQQFLTTFDEGSDEWWEVASTLNSIESELDDVTASIQDLNDAIAQIRWDNFEEFDKRLSNLISDIENVRNILSNEDMFDAEGNWTEEGVATLATYIQEIEMYRSMIEDANSEFNQTLADFGQGYEGREDYFQNTYSIDSEQEYYDKLRELTDQQSEYTQAIKDSEKSVVEMYENQIDAVEKYIDTLVDGYNDYIDSVKEALDAERDYTLWKQSYSPLYMETYIMYSFELLENP